MAYSGRNDVLIWTDGSGKIDVRADADMRSYQLIRVADGMALENFGALADAQNRANAMITNGEVT
jgi:hypothetical protein